MALQINGTKGEEVVDPFNHRQMYERLLETKVNLFERVDQEVVRSYLSDMLSGRNVAGKKGARGFTHLTTLIFRLSKISEYLMKHYNKTLLEPTADQIHDLFEKMANGKIPNDRGERYKSTHDYIKIYKAFRRWHMRRMRKEGKSVEDITIDLSGTPDHKPDFVFFTFDSLKQMMNEADFKYRALMLFLFDSGIRAPTELFNVKAKDLTEDKASGKLQLEIREETSKTFGRKFKLMLSSEIMREYLEKGKFKKDDFIFQIGAPNNINKQLKRISERAFGKNLEHLKEHTKSKRRLTMYDFRHSSCCYWLPRYKNESALKWRFGWKKPSMIFYYSEFLGMKDTITQDDMLVDTTKTELENALEVEKQARLLMEERMKELEKKLAFLDRAKKNEVI